VVNQSGVVTDVIITNSGSGYTTAPTITGFSGGSGASVNATVNAIAGGLKKMGSGTLTISGTNTYAGKTEITAGTFKMSTGSSISNTSEIIVQTNTTLDISSVNFTLGATSNQTLSGTGIIVGNMSVGTNGTLAIGNSPGTMTFNNDLTLSSGSISNFEINGFTIGNYDLALAATAGTQTVYFNGGTLNLLFQEGFNTQGFVKIFDFDGYAGTGFTTINTSGLAMGYSATFDSTNGIVTVIPEPSVGLLGAFGALVFTRRRRKQA
jgi:fibronectin-binding autotransporter adhesin